VPINFAQMLLQPTKATPWDLSPTGAGTAREQLKLAREKFEFDKKRAEEEDRLAREKQAAEMAKARLEVEATKAAKLQEDRLKVYGEFTKASGEGNIEAMRSMVPMLHSLGMDIELEGEEGGLPRYRVGMDASAAQQAESEQLAKTSPYGEDETAEQSLSRLGAMGLGGETGSLLPPLGIRGSDEVDPATGQSVADRVAATYGMPGEKTATRGPDEEDFTGGVPKNVIDMGASAASTLHRLDPSLKAAAAAYPDAQTSAAAEQLRLGLRGSGLPYEKQQAAFDKAISGPASQRNAQIAADAQAERFRETRDQLTEVQKAGLQEQGRTEADRFSKDLKMADVGNAFRAGKTILDVLDDKDPNNDSMIASELMTFQNVKGTPSDTDLKMAFNIPMATAMDQAFTMIKQMVMGGMQAPQKEAIRAYMKAKTAELTTASFEYLDQAQLRASGDTFNEHSRKAFLQNVKSSVPGHVYNAWLDMKKGRDEGSGGDPGKGAELSGKGGKYDPNSVNSDLADMSDFDLELEGQALENDLDPGKIRRIIGPESGGKADARNPKSGATGLIQFLPSIARDLGTSTEELAKMSATEQLPFVMKYLSDRGVTSDSSAEDYVMAVAAPAFIGKPPETVVYRKGSKEWEQNPAWRPPGGGDITVDSIGRFYRGGGKEDGAKGAAKLPEPKTPAEKRYLELLKKRGG
jgi:hypothetical protein